MAGRGQPGRADKLTPETQKKILDAVRAGAYMEQAAHHAGINQATLYRWLERGAGDDAPARFREFREALTRARADAEVGAVAALRRAMPDDWRAAAFFLERSFPVRWRRRDSHEHTGPDGGPVRITDVDLSRLPAEDLEQLERILKAAGDAADAR